MTIIIGIDPGSRVTGYGVIQVAQNKNKHLAHGVLQLTDKNFAVRLQKIFFGIQDIIQQFNPAEAAIEQVFMHQNPGSALKLGQARGAAIVALNMEVAEYSARQVKQAIVGYGAASKMQIQMMVKRLLNLDNDLQADAADALAIALCHAHSRSKINRAPIYRRSKRNSWRAFVENN